METRLPAPLAPGAKVAILSPASIIRPEYVEGACATLRHMGFSPEVMPHTLGACGSFAGTHAERLSDLCRAMADPVVDAIICSRGGYGCAHLLGELDADPSLWRRPKWLVGFSDISALHALWGKHGISSVHASMTKHLALGAGDPLNRRLLSLLSGNGLPPVEWTAPADAAAANRSGVATATLRGGNLAVISALLRTPFDPFIAGSILLLEDIAEPIYKVERIMWQLRMSGVLGQLAGLIVGQFTDYRPSRDHDSMEKMLARFAPDVPDPVAFGAPVGHIDANHPVLLNATATLRVDGARASLSW